MLELFSPGSWTLSTWHWEAPKRRLLLLCTSGLWLIMIWHHVGLSNPGKIQMKFIIGISLGWWRSTLRRCCQQTQDLSSRRRLNFLGNMIGRCLQFKCIPSIHIYKLRVSMMIDDNLYDWSEKVTKGDKVESGGRVSVSLLDLGAAPTSSLQRWIWREHHSTGAFLKLTM